MMTDLDCKSELVLVRLQFEPALEIDEPSLQVYST